MTPSPRSILIVTNVLHYRFRDKLFAYGPYALEVDLWGDLFAEVVIAGPCRDGMPNGDCLAFRRSNISIWPVRETGGTTWRAKGAQMLALPELMWTLGRAMREVDAVHIRCPCNLGLVGVLVAPLLSPYLIAKFAGQWAGYAGEPWTVRLQRALLQSRWWRGPAIVYGRQQNDPSHIVSFFATSLTREQLARAQAAARTKEMSDPLRVLYVGRLVPSKNVDTLLAAVADLAARRVAVDCTIIGDGPERPNLEEMARELRVQESVTFTGALPFEQVLGHYERAGVLVLASESEGWCKAVTEGMAFGLVCIGSDRGSVAELLGDARGVVIPPRDAVRLAQVLSHIAEMPQAYAEMRARAAAWSQRYSREGFKEALYETLTSHWGVQVGGSRNEHQRQASTLQS
jgi:glycosyltransferase involved in cell wall biosynthesis